MDISAHDVTASLCGLLREFFTSRKALTAGTPGLVDHHHRLFQQVAFDDNALDGSCQVGATTGPGRHDKFNRSGGFPGRERRRRQSNLRKDRSQHRKFRISRILNQ
jgi:hypothetical protein